MDNAVMRLDQLFTVALKCALSKIACVVLEYGHMWYWSTGRDLVWIVMYAHQ